MITGSSLPLYFILTPYTAVSACEAAPVNKHRSLCHQETNKTPSLTHETRVEKHLDNRQQDFVVRLESPGPGPGPASEDFSPYRECPGPSSNAICSSPKALNSDSDDLNPSRETPETDSWQHGRV